MTAYGLRPRGAALALAATALVLGVYPGVASAQQARSFSPQLFHPAPGPDEFITVEPAVPLGHKAYSLGLTLNWARDEFTIFSYDQQKGSTTSVRANLIENALGGELWGAFGFLDRFQVALSLPMTLFQNGVSFDDVNPPPDGTHVKAPNGFAFGDPRVYLKARLYGRQRGIQLALSHWLGVPLGNDREFGGEKHFSGFSGEARLLAGWESELWRVGAFLGFNWRAHVSQFFSTIVGNQLTYGGAVALGPLAKRVTLVAELYGHSNSVDTIEVKSSAGKNSITDINDNPLEFDIAAKVMVVYGLTLHLGVGNGIIAGLGSPQPRLFFGAVWAPSFADADKDGIPDQADQCPTRPEDKDGFKDADGCPDDDNDADTIPDAQDKCPNQAEDFDQFQDDDGCPEPDNDKDGIDDLHDACPNDAEDHQGPKPSDGCPLAKTDTDGDGIDDARDKCPKDPEDKDGFEDQDGCPDPDNDGDGIPDNFDQCPNAAEDQDGYQDDDGCPDPDDDKDGVPDKADKCPKEPETINGFQDDDGCPDAGPPPKAKIDVAKKQIVIMDKIFFDTDKATIKPKSFGLLDQVAQILRGHTEIKVEIQGHTDARGDLEHNVQLSKERADSVRTYLIKQNVDPTRMVSAGYGPTRPIADNHTRAGREANRRVEFHIIEEPPPAGKAPAGGATDSGANNDGNKEQ